MLVGDGAWRLTLGGALGTPLETPAGTVLVGLAVLPRTWIGAEMVAFTGLLLSGPLGTAGITDFGFLLRKFGSFLIWTLESGHVCHVDP